MVEIKKIVTTTNIDDGVDSKPLIQSWWNCMMSKVAMSNLIVT